MFRHKKKGSAKKRKVSLLISVGLLLTVVFLSSVLLNSAEFRYLYYVVQTGKANDDGKRIVDYVRDELYSYEALPWLMTYWKEHSNSMDIPIGGLKDPNWKKSHDDFMDAFVKNISIDEVQAFSEDEQKEFAEVCYMRCASFFDRVKQDFDVNNINCSMYNGDGTSFAFFKSVDESSAKGRYSLGESWPFDIKLHSVASKIYDTGEDQGNLEFVTSTTDDQKYAFVYSTIKVEGQVVGVICETIPISDLLEQISFGVDVLRKANLQFFIIVFIILLSLVYFMLIRPLVQIQKGVRGYKSDKDSGAIGKRLKRLAKKQNEIGILAEDVTEMAVEMDRYVEEIKSVTAEKERIGAELDMAASIQSGSLPHRFPAFPERNEFDIYAIMDPAKEVGGDFYDFFLTDDDHLALVVADVSGKGIPAALFMMVSKTVIRSLANTQKSPKDILYAANSILCQNNEEFMFVTLWLGILEISTGELVFADAGHEKPALYHDKKWQLLEKKSMGMALGMADPQELLELDEKYQYTDTIIKLDPGDMIMQYTDGVTEASDSDNNQFGEEGLLSALSVITDTTPEKLLLHVQEEIDDFVKKSPQFDDITMLALLYK